jgi:hypothetical protein
MAWILKYSRINLKRSREGIEEYKKEIKEGINNTDEDDKSLTKITAYNPHKYPNYTKTPNTPFALKRNNVQICTPTGYRLAIPASKGIERETADKFLNLEYKEHIS